MKALLKNVFFFGIPLLLAPALEGAYKVFVLGVVDSKFAGDSWMAYQVWLGLGLITFIFLGIAFLVLSFLSSKLTKLELSVKHSFVLGLSVCVLTYAYGLIRSKFFGAIYDPVDVGNVLLIISFIGLNIFAKFGQKKKKEYLVKLGDDKAALKAHDEA